MSADIKRIRNEFFFFVGLTVVALTVGGLVIYGVYTVIGELTDEGRRILSTALVFAVVGAYLLGLQVAKSHKAGFKAALDLRLDAKQTARPVVTKPVAPAPDRYTDILPTVQRAQIIMRTDQSQSALDM